MRRKGYLFMAGITAVVILAMIYPSDKKRIKKVIHGCSEALEQEDIEQLMKAISFNYSDGRGGSYLQIKKRAELLFQRFDDFEVRADVMVIRIKETQAEADLAVSVLASEGRDRGYIIGGAEGAHNIMVSLAKSPYAWKIINIKGAVNR